MLRIVETSILQMIIQKRRLISDFELHSEFLTIQFHFTNWAS